MRPYFFTVAFPAKQIYTGIDSDVISVFESYTKKFLLPSDLDPQSGLFKLEPWHVKNVTIPDFSFKKDGVVKYGPFAKSVPVMDFDGFELKIELEEDKTGTIKRLAQWLQARNIHKTGTYWPPALSSLSYIEINILAQTPNNDGTDKIIGSFKFNEVHLLDVGEATFSYSDNTPITYSFTFNANYYTYEWNKE
jgi:hypothetical protein